MDGRRRAEGRRLLCGRIAFLFATLMLAGVGAAQGIERRDFNPPAVARPQGSGSALLLKRRAELLQAEQRRLMVGEAQRILAVATDLSSSVGKEALTATVDDEAWKRAEAIERLARNVRLRMLGAH